MIHFKARGFCIHQDFVTGDWGEFVSYIEVADDHFAARQVNLFSVCKVLRYDRSHWCDDYGMLVALKFSQKPKWRKFFKDAVEITNVDFEKIWRTALRSDMWDEQVMRSRIFKWGEFRTH